MDETKEKKPPLDREEFKLLSRNEHKFIENPTGLLKNYKSPDAMARQFNNLIKYRTTNAIIETAWMCEKLHDDQLKKIFTDDRIHELFKITETALDVAAWEPDQTKIEFRRTDIKDPHELSLEKHLKVLMEHYMPKKLIKPHEELREKYITPSAVNVDLMILNGRLGLALQKNEDMRSFIEKKGLTKEVEQFTQKVRNDVLTSLE
jgi:hypothetical protein